MKTLQSISALFIVLLLAMSGNTTPISIAHGSLDLEHMKISTTLEDAPGISAGGSSFYCDLKGKDKYFTSGDYLKIFHKGSADTKGEYKKNFRPRLLKLDIPEKVIRDYWRFLDEFSTWMVNTPVEQAVIQNVKQ